MSSEFESDPSNRREPAFHRFTALPRPFLRWAGSKQALLPHITERLPLEFGRYYEPFLGSGALFFHLKPKRATLADSSRELISTWIAVRDNVDFLSRYLSPLKPDRELFYQIRSKRSRDIATRASEFIYLNKTCWNGLYRVNSKGEFNVPYGFPKTDFIFDEENLRCCSAALRKSRISLRVGDFERVVSTAREGDFVYLDPPYVTKHNNNGFRDWNEKIFSWGDQVRLASVATALSKRGVKIMISNANHADIIGLYGRFDVSTFDRASTLSSSPRFRGRVGEVLITSNV